jgi:hypothetical protein
MAFFKNKISSAFNPYYIHSEELYGLTNYHKFSPVCGFLLYIFLYKCTGLPNIADSKLVNPIASSNWSANFLTGLNSLWNSYANLSNYLEYKFPICLILASGFAYCGSTRRLNEFIYLTSG